MSDPIVFYVFLAFASGIVTGAVTTFYIVFRSIE